MELLVRVYTLVGDVAFSRIIHLNSLEVNEILEDYIRREYLNENETLVSINCEG